MCTNFPNIRITEGNNFSIILPLLSRTYVATRPIDEAIDPQQLENLHVTFGGVEYTAQRTEGGVQIDLPATLAVGTYDILLTAEYLGSEIRAAYESAVTIVPWSAQSTAEQYITGSPVTLRAAYVLSGAMTDAELEALKQEYREKNAQLDQAIEEYERRAAELDGVAQQATLTQGVQDIRADIAGIDIDTSTLAKEATLGTPAVGQPSTIFAAIAAVAQSDDSKQTIVDAINHMGGTATALMTWAQLAAQIESLQVIAPEIEFLPSFPTPPYSLFYFMQSNFINYGVKRIVDDKIDGFIYSAYSGGFWFNNRDLEYVEFKKAIGVGQYFCFGCPNVKKILLPSVSSIGSNSFQQSTFIHTIDVSSMPNYGGMILSTNIIDLIIGGAFSSDVNMLHYNPTNCYLNTSGSLCFDTDLEEYGRIFANNFEKWKWCIINHYAANLQDRTGMNAYTITFGSNALSHFDAEMIAAFTDKNWNLA